MGCEQRSKQEKQQYGNGNCVREDMLYPAHSLAPSLEEASRCINCKNAKCITGCPVSIDIPAFIAQVKEGNFDEAYQIISKSSALPAVCGRVCPQESQCEGKCIRGIKGEPVSIGKLERFVADWARENGVKPQPAAEKNGHKVAVIGSGPAGLTCAGDLAKLGYDVTIFEALHKPGGVLVYGIPEFRLPKTILDRYYVKMKELGIRFRPNFALGGSTGVQDLLKDGYDAVFIGTGTWRPYRLNIPGETFGNVHYGINYLNNPDVYDLGERVAVIGAGNAAMDVARTAIRKGSQHVTVYSVTEVPAASPKEVEYAKIDGVQFEFLQTAVEIKDDGVMICDVEWDEKGQMIKHEETARFVSADSIIISISQGPQDRIVNRDKELKVDEKGLLKTDEKGETTMKGIFASGDVVTGAKTVVEAVKCSKMIADAMDEYVRQTKPNLFSPSSAL